MFGVDQLTTVKSPNYTFLFTHAPILVKHAAQAEKCIFEGLNLFHQTPSISRSPRPTDKRLCRCLFSFSPKALIDLLDRHSNKGILSTDVTHHFHGILNTSNLFVHNQIRGSKRRPISIALVRNCRSCPSTRTRRLEASANASTLGESFGTFPN